MRTMDESAIWMVIVALTVFFAVGCTYVEGPGEDGEGQSEVCAGWDCDDGETPETPSCGFGCAVCDGGTCLDYDEPWSECVADADCRGATDVCIGGQCIACESCTAGACDSRERCSGDGFCIPSDRCRSEADCTAGQVCAPNGHCSAPVDDEGDQVGDGGENGEGACVFNADCGEQAVCLDGRCLTNPSAPQCTRNAECPDNFVCLDAECREPCTCDDDCGPAAICFAGACVPE